MDTNRREPSNSSRPNESLWRFLFQHSPGWIQAITGVVALIVGFAGGYGYRTATEQPSRGTVSPASSTGSPRPESSTPQVPPGTVLAQAERIDLADGYALPLAGQELRPVQADTGDLYVSAGDVRSSQQMAVFDGPPSYSACFGDTQFTNDVSYVDNLTSKTICVTVGHRIVAAAVTADHRNDNSVSTHLTMDVTIYQGP